MLLRRLRKPVAVLLTAALLSCAGCGTKETEKVTGYGGGTGTSESPEKKDTEATSKTSQEATENKTTVSGDWQLLSDQLGGTRLTCTNSFSVGSLPARFDVDYQLKDSGILPTYKVHQITRDRVYEKEILENFFDGPAKEVHEAFTEKTEVSETILTIGVDLFYMRGGEYKENEPLNINPWVDENGFFLHTYEGKYLNTDYYLVIAWDEESSLKRIGFGPKKWGDVVGSPTCNRMMLVAEDGMVFVGDSKTEVSEVPLSEVMKDPKNRATVSEDEILRMTRELTEDTLKFKLMQGSIIPKMKRTSYANFYDGSSGYSVGSDTEDLSDEALLFYPGDAAVGDRLFSESLSLGERPEETVLNGYHSELSREIAGQEYAPTDSFFLKANMGDMYINDQGIIAADFQIVYDFEECLSDRTNILSFEKTVEAMQENLIRELDVSKVPGSKLTVREMTLAYFPIPSPENNGECTYLPVWCASVYSNDSYMLGILIQNAVDGSFVKILYN